MLLISTVSEHHNSYHTNTFISSFDLNKASFAELITSSEAKITSAKMPRDTLGVV